MKHSITIEDLKDYKITSEIAGCHGKGSNKSLKVITEVSNNLIRYEVWDHGELVQETRSFEKAINLYNEV
ncbi:MAG: hypothetical protein GY853_09840 [PVC group bacterium]|nr:hypothetical protein [PVC group bacterium]